MPLVRIAAKLVFFAHVPKCAGTAVDRYLKRRFGPLALHDGQYMQRPSESRWSKSSPQHIEAAALERLFPPDFLDAGFAVVRHPAKRLLSAFLFQRDIQLFLARDTDFSQWLEELAEEKRKNPYYLDNHARSMSELVPETFTVFHLENGLDPVVAWLDDIAGEQGGPREIAAANSYSRELEWRKLERGPNVTLTPRFLEKVADIYAEDYERFGYPVEIDTTERSFLTDQ